MLRALTTARCPTAAFGPRTIRGRPVRVQARTALRFRDFALTQPRVLRVLSIEDHIRLEVDRTVRPAS